MYISDTTGSKAALDLTLWTQDQHCYIRGRYSDHIPISIEYNCITEPGKVSKTAPIGLPLWKKLRKNITEVETHNEWNREKDVEERYENCTQIIKGKLEETTLKRKIENNLENGGQGKTGSKDKQPDCVWWNGECDTVIRIRKAELLKWKYCKIEETFLEYKSATSAKNRLREIKHKNWKTFCEGIDKYTNPSYIWNRMKRLKFRYNMTEKEHEYKDELLNYLHPPKKDF
jgi:hypothetical protein